MDQLSAMRAFLRVVETGNFTRASAALGMPKATVSNLIQKPVIHDCNARTGGDNFEAIPQARGADAGDGGKLRTATMRHRNLQQRPS